MVFNFLLHDSFKIISTAFYVTCMRLCTGSSEPSLLVNEPSLITSIDCRINIDEIV